MAITAVANITYAGGFAAGTNSTTIVRANADLANVAIGDVVNNTTRSAKSWIVNKVVGGTNTTLTLHTLASIASQTTTDSITFEPAIQVVGESYTSTATSGTATTITKTAAGWTVNAYANRIVYISAGTGVGASAMILSNTATVLTVANGFYRQNTSTRAFEAVTPDNTSVFRICYNFADVVAAVATYATWSGDATSKVLNVTKNIHIQSGGYFGEVNGTLNFTTLRSSLTGVIGGFVQFGRQNNAYAGLQGCEIVVNLPVTPAAWLDLDYFGKLKMFGCLVQTIDNMDGAEVRYNLNWGVGDPSNDGLEFVDTTTKNIYWTVWSKDKMANVNVDRVTTLAFSGASMSGMKFIGTTISPGSFGGTSSGASGMDFFDHTTVGSVLGSGAFVDPVVVGDWVLPLGVAYFWNPSFPTALADTIGYWYNAPYANAGHTWIGRTIALSVKNAAGTGIQDARVAVLNAADGVTSALMTSKGASGANYGPVYSSSIATLSGGGYTGPFGTNEGLFVVTNKLVATNTSAWVHTSTVTNYGPFTFKIRKYAYYAQEYSRDWTGRSTENITMIANPFTVANEATAGAYTGIAIDGAAKTITVSGTRTIQELYDYSQWWIAQDANIKYQEPLTTSNGTEFTLTTGWSLIVSGTLTSATQKVTGTKSVSGSGLYEDTTVTMKYMSSNTYYFSKITLVTKVGGSATNGIRVAFTDSTNTNRTYNTSLSAVDNIASAGSGNISGYVLYKVGSTTYTGHTLKVREYEYQLSDLPVTVNGTPIVSDVTAVADAFIVANEATAGAYTGIAANYSTPAVTVTATHTIQKLYDYLKYNHIQPANYDKANLPLTTSNGTVFQFGTNWNLVVGASGNVTEIAKTVTYTGTGALTTSSGGIFEDSGLAQWEASGTVYKASHFYTNVKAITGGGNIQSAIVAYINSTGVDVTYNTSRVNGGIATDASGNAEGYVVFAIGATVNNSINQYIGEYNYQWSTIPKTVTGSPIGSSGTYETVRLVTDTQVTLTKTNALAVSGITVTAGSTNVDLSDELLTAAYDNLKARQATASVIETGVKGYTNFYSYGLLISKDGTTYTLKTGWDFDNWNTSETGTFRGGQLNFDTPGTYSLNFYDNLFNFTSVGTYDFRNAVTTGTISLDQTGDVAVTAQFHPDATLDNLDEDYITVEASVAIVISINPLRTGTRFQLYDVTNDTELMNEISDAQPEEYNYTYSTPTTIRLRVMYNDGTDCDEWIEVTGLTSANGLAFNVTPTTDLVYVANGVDGSTVTECSISGSIIKIYLDDPDGLTTWQRIYAWYRYYLGTEAGIREQNGSYITMPTQTLIQFDTNILQINNQDTNPLIISGANIITDSGDINDAFDYAGSNGSINNNPDIVVPFVYASETVNVWNEPPTVGQIADGVWDEVIHTGHDIPYSAASDLVGVAGSTSLTKEEIREEIDDNSTKLKKINNDVLGLY